MGTRVIAACGCLLPLSLIAVGVTYRTIPTHNTESGRFDTLIVLGSPPNPDGSPSSEESERVTEAVCEYRAGRAAHIIVTGGTVASAQPEGEVMAQIAKAEGVPSTALVIEPQARNTLQNIYFSHLLMKQKGWTSAEVVSSPSHLPRAALILEHYQIGWRTQPALWPPEYSRRRIGRYYLHEVPGTVLLRWFGFRPSPFLPEKGPVSAADMPCFPWSTKLASGRCA